MLNKKVMAICFSLALFGYIACYGKKTIGFTTRDGNKLSDINIRFRSAAYRGKLKKVERLLKRGADINSQEGGSGPSALHYAADGKQFLIVEFLLQKCASLEIKNNRGETPLFRAVKAGDLNIIRFLLAKGADINAVSERQQNILHVASSVGNKEVLKLLLEKGARHLVNSCSTWPYPRTPLFNAVEDGQEEAIDLLLEYGADAKRECNLKSERYLEPGCPWEAALRGKNERIIKKLSGR